MMELIDTHCHLTFEQLAWEIDEVVQRSIAAGVTGWITIGIDPQHNRQAVELASRFENMYTAVGIHPHDAKYVTVDTMDELKELARSEKVVAIGETGLDFHYDFSPRQDQRRIFEAQLEIARVLNLPVIIHCREAFDETIDILEQFIGLKGRLKGVVFHCFGGSAQQARIILDHGFYISLPADKLMLETDCPYMSPAPMRKRKINEPALMVHTARFLAELKEIDPADFARDVTAASKSFFGLP